MQIKLKKIADEESSYFIIIEPFDEDDAAETPITLTWTLTDVMGNIINLREDVAITPLSTSMTVILTGDDLSIPEDKSPVTRLFSVKGTYDSDLQAGLAITGYVQFDIKANKTITAA